MPRGGQGEGGDGDRLVLSDVGVVELHVAATACDGDRALQWVMVPALFFDPEMAGVCAAACGRRAGSGPCALDGLNAHRSGLEPVGGQCDLYQQIAAIGATVFAGSVPERSCSLGDVPTAASIASRAALRAAGEN